MLRSLSLRTLASHIFVHKNNKVKMKRAPNKKQEPTE